MKPRLALIPLTIAFLIALAPARLQAAPEEAPVLHEEPATHINLLPRALRLEGSGGAGGVFFPSQRPARQKNPEQEEKAYTDALVLLYRDFRARGGSAGRLEASTLNDLALLATTLGDTDAAESLLLLAMAKEDSLPVRLNLAFLHLRANETEGRSMILGLRERLSDSRRAEVVRELFARGFPEEAAIFVATWIKESGSEISPILMENGKLVGSYHLFRGRADEARSIYRSLDNRTTGDPGVILGLARSLSDKPSESLAAYRRLMALPAKAFAPEKGPSDEALREYAVLCAKLHDFKNVEKALASLRHPFYDDVRTRILAHLRLEPDANVEPLIAIVSKMHQQELRPSRTGPFAGPASRPGKPTEADMTATGFHALLEGALDTTLPVIAAMQIRLEIFGSADPAQVERDRRGIRRLF